MNKIIKWLEKPLNRVIFLLPPLFLFLISVLIVYIKTMFFGMMITLPLLICFLIGGIWIASSFAFVLWCDNKKDNKI